MQPYEDFLATKRFEDAPSGLDVPLDALSPVLYPFQQALTRWALQRGRAGLFAHTGLGKTLMLLEWAEHIPGPVLIFAPLAVTHQIVRESQKRFGRPVEYVRHPDQITQRVVVTNYDMMRNFFDAPFTGIVCDECFPAGTLVDTPEGQKAIETIREGDHVCNAWGIDTVEATTTREITTLAHVRFSDGRTIICSENHPFFTRHGIIQASQLKNGDYTYGTSEAMRMVQDTLYDPTLAAADMLTNLSSSVFEGFWEKQDANVLSILPSAITAEAPCHPFLQSVVLGQMAHATTRDTITCLFNNKEYQHFQRAAAMVSARFSHGATTARAHTQAQSYGPSRGASKNFSDVAHNRPCPVSARRQWEAFDAATTNFTQRSGRGLVSRISHFLGQEDARLPHMLQGRPGESHAHACSRGGWTDPSQNNRNRPEKGSQARGAWVDSVEIYESSDPRFRARSRGNDSIQCYDLQVARHPSYSVEGVLVHNSSRMKHVGSKTREELLTHFTHIPYRLCCTATPAPNDISEIGNHCEFLGVMKRTDMLSTFFVHDDCFVGETPIDTPEGQRHIQDIEPGDNVFNAYGVDEVFATSTKELSCLVEIVYGGQSVLCSEYHPWLTTRGWKAAHTLQEGDELVSCREAMRLVHEAICGSLQEEQPQRTILQQTLCDEMAITRPYRESQNLYTSDGAKVIESDNGLFCIRKSRSREAQRASAPIQAISTTRSGQENQPDNERTWHFPPQASAFSQRRMGAWDTERQRDRVHAGASDTSPSIRTGMGSRGDYSLGLSDSRIPQLLPCRSTLSINKVNCRDRWENPHQASSKGTRPEEDNLPRIIRVDRVEIHKHGSETFTRHSAGKDTVTLYDLKVKHHPSFSIHNVLVHNSGWRLRGHAADAFYRWLASWAMALRSPEDLGFDGSAFVLPPLTIKPHFVRADYRREGELLPSVGLKGITDRSAVRRGTIAEKVAIAAQLARDAEGQVTIWCGLNDEATAMAAALREESLVEVAGSDSLASKETKLLSFLDDTTRILVSKPAICGQGLNLQNAHTAIFVGLSDSWESWFQTIRRLWRYGQTREVVVHVVLSDHEQPILENIQRKEQQAERMVTNMIQHMQAYEQDALREQAAPVAAEAIQHFTGPGWDLYQGDCVEGLKAVEANSVGLSVFSPPFLTLYQYSATERDLGNSQDAAAFFAHFRYVADELMRVTMPGRHVAMHVSQVPAMLIRDGWIGMKDFRGEMVRHMEQFGWIYHGEVVIDKDPQAQAIRIRAKGLAFQQLHKDASWMRPALADYILLFRKPGENPVPIVPDVDNETWIQWARPIWYGIHETGTLNAAEARDHADDRHICPLALDIIERCVRLWSNQNEVVLDPFSGIGSTGVVAIKEGRRFVGCELKATYAATAIKNLGLALQAQDQQSLF